MRLLAALLTAGLVVLAGCADESHSHTVTCDDGTEIDYSDDPHHDNETFEPLDLCLPDPLVVLLEGVPETVGAYQGTEVRFVLDLAGRASAHSMDNQVRIATVSALPGPADGPDAYGEEAGRMQHQDLPVDFTSALSFDAPGTYYVRGVAEVDGTYVWSEEHTVEVTPVTPTGMTHEVVHAAGLFVGGVSPLEVAATLGDSLVFVNDDVIAHTFTFGSGPLAPLEVTIDAQSSSDPILLDVPGNSQATSDDLQSPATVTIRVLLPS